MEPKLEALATLVAVVEAGSLTAAAKRLGLAKSVVSKRLTDLEQAVGTELIRRSTRLARPTDAGLAFHRRAKKILAELDVAMEEAGGKDGPLRGPLRVAAPLTFGWLYLVGPLVAFAQANPEIELALDCDDKRVDIAQGGYDLAIRIGRLADSALLARKIAEAPGVLLASPTYLARRGAPTRLDDLESHECIAYANAPTIHHWSFVEKGSERQVSVRPRVSVNSGEVILQAAIAGLGLAILPRFMVADALRDGRLVSLLPQTPPTGSAIYVLRPPGTELSRKVRALIDLLAAHIPPALKEAGAL